MANGNGSKIIGRQLVALVSGLVRKIAAADSPPPILITGETGTGKGLLAETIHRHSSRGDRPFVAVNCGAIPPSLIESELFGHKKGSFTSAVANRAGKFQAAQDGTLFLDEIGELPVDLQSKLLHVLEDGSYYPVGGDHCLQSQCAVICATNQDLQGMIKAKTFRPDLYYRVNVIRIDIPPLRQRQLDILDLLDFFIARHQDASRSLTMTKDANELLVDYPWPGNVREVENWIRRLCLLHDGGSVTDDDIRSIFREELARQGSPEKAVLLPVIGEAADDRLKSSLKLVFGPEPERAGIRPRLIGSALELFDGNIKSAARLLGLSYATVYTDCQKHGLDYGQNFSCSADEQLKRAMYVVAEYAGKQIAKNKKTFHDMLWEVEKTLADDPLSVR